MRSFQAIHNDKCERTEFGYSKLNAFTIICEFHQLTLNQFFGTITVLNVDRQVIQYLLTCSRIGWQAITQW
ncbi:hypothetical protein D3C75_1194600 [compost metagenome]